MTVRSLMIAVAAVAVASAAGVWYLGATPWAWHCRDRAIFHSRNAGIWMWFVNAAAKGCIDITVTRSNDGVYLLDCDDRPQYLRQRPTSPEAAAEFDRRRAEAAAICRALAEYHMQMRQKWLRAAYRPWEGVAPDPPPPLRIMPSVRDVSL